MKVIINFLLIFFILSYIAFCGYREVQIPTRVNDPAKKYLAADIYVLDSTVKKPTVLIQTPYNKIYYRSLESIPQEGGTQIPFDTINYNYVVLDWRGFYANKDDDSTGYDRGKDGYDVVEWIAQQPWSDGKVGTYGGSALGYIQFQTARLHPPHLVCAVPMIKDFETQYEEYYYGGDYRKEHVESMQKLGFLTTSLILAHSTQDIFWNVAKQTTDCASEIDVPMLLISGWFDHYPSDCIRAFEDLKSKSGDSVRNKHKLIMGPWLHMSLGLAEQGVLSFPNAAGIPNEAVQKFFDYYLRNIGNGWENEPVIKYYQMGTEEWLTTDEWSNVEQGTDTLYLNENSSLTSEAPINNENSFDSVIYNPLDPSPTYGGSRFNPFDPTIKTGPQDQRSVVESRPDALLYTTPVLDKDYIINGKVNIELFVSSDKTDTDFGVRLCDFYPDGSSILMTQGIKRMRFRNSYVTEVLMNPGKLYPVKVELNDLSMNFKAGHRIRIIVTNSNYPMFDINLNNGGTLYQPGDTLTATNYVEHSTLYQSRVLMPVQKITSVENYIQSTSNRLTITPNPANGNCSVNYVLDKDVNVSISIYNSIGQNLNNYYYNNMAKGYHSVNLLLSTLQPGFYFIVLKIDAGVKVAKFIRY